MSRPPRPNLLMVEGTTDALVANHLADLHALPDDYDFKDYEGIDALLRALPQRLRESERRRLALVVDADGDPPARWAAIRDRLAPSAYTLPAEPEPDGTVLASPSEELPIVGIWMMPDNRSSGILEDFVQKLVPPDNPLLLRARQAVKEIPSDLRRFRKQHAPKAEIYTWLAWQEKPGCSFGPAVKSGLLDGNQPAAKDFMAWLRRVFDHDPGTTA